MLYATERVMRARFPLTMLFWVKVLHVPLLSPSYVARPIFPVKTNSGR